MHVVGSSCRVVVRLNHSGANGPSHKWASLLSESLPPDNLALVYPRLEQKQTAVGQAQQAIKDYGTDAVDQPAAMAALADPSAFRRLRRSNCCLYRSLGREGDRKAAARKTVEVPNVTLSCILKILAGPC